MIKRDIGYWLVAIGILFLICVAGDRLNLADDRHTTESLEYSKTIESLNERIDKITVQTTTAQATTIETVIIEDEPLGTLWDGKPVLSEPVQATTTAPVMEYVGTFKVSAYCSCALCCGGKSDGITASGAKVQEGVTVAADKRYFAFGTKIHLSSVGDRIVQDRGVSGKSIDLYFSSHQDAINFGVQYLDVYIVK